MAGIKAVDVPQLLDNIKELELNFKAATAELKTTLKKLMKTERMYQKACSYNEDLRAELDKLSRETHDLRQAAQVKVVTADVGTQVTGNDFAVSVLETTCNVTSQDDHQEDNPTPSKKETSASLAESLKTAAEEAMNQSGFVFDERTGLYYDYNSGYYYDADKSLYYEPYSGTYYSYNTETETYEEHSQVDWSQYPELYQQMETTEAAVESSVTTKNKTSTETSTEEADKTEKREKCDKHRKDEKRKAEKRKRREHERRKAKRRQREKQDSSSRRKSKRKRHERKSNEKHSQQDMLDSDVVRKKSKRSICDNAAETTVKSEYITCPSCGYTGPEVIEDMKPETDVAPSEVPVDFPPCIRAMVKISDSLDIGTLFIITCSGATMGRDKELHHTVTIPDIQVSKMHCDLRYNEKLQCYQVQDHASQNGTFLNGQRISETKKMSNPFPVSHLDQLKVGGTTFDLHIHPGTDTCDWCEPGQVQAQVKAEQVKSEPVIVSKDNREKQRRAELKRIKKMFGLANADYETNTSAINNPNYEDKAAERRRTVGSDNPHQKDDLPASVHRSIPSANKGHKLLEKMGWKEGDVLGLSQAGLREPIQINIRTKQTAGLGSHMGSQRSADDVWESVAAGKWVKAQDRFEKLTDGSVNQGQVKPEKKISQWVSGKTLNFSENDTKQNNDVT